MTDAAVPVTGRAVERVVEAYLTALGADITKEGRRWSVTLSGADTDLDVDGATLEVTDDPDDASEDAVAVAPESPFVERLLEEAADRAPVGSLALTGETVDLNLPDWATAGSVDPVDRTFTPYYDRRAVCVLFQVGIETVSEYERETLRAVAVDCTDYDRRPKLAESVLELIDEGQSLEEGPPVDRQTVAEGIDAARTVVEDELEPAIAETRGRASRAAAAELDEYRQYATQRREELSDEIDRVTDRIEELSETIDAGTQQERVSALRKRKELRAELEELRSERERLTARIESGFREKRQAIWDRHALTVRVRPVTATVVTYERGDLELTLQSDETTVTRSYGYALGTGVVEAATCDRCGRQVSDDNPLVLDGQTLVGDTCCDR